MRRLMGDADPYDDFADLGDQEPACVMKPGAPPVETDLAYANADMSEKRAATKALVERHKTLDVGEEYERRLAARDEDEQAEKAARREAKRQRREEQAAADQEEDPNFDAEMNAMMGFGGFGGSKKQR